MTALFTVFVGQFILHASLWGLDNRSKSGLRIEDINPTAQVVLWIWTLVVLFIMNTYFIQQVYADFRESSSGTIHILGTAVILLSLVPNCIILYLTASPKQHPLNSLPRIVRTWNIVVLWILLFVSLLIILLNQSYKKEGIRQLYTSTKKTFAEAERSLKILISAAGVFAIGLIVSGVLASAFRPEDSEHYPKVIIAVYVFTALVGIMLLSTAAYKYMMSTLHQAELPTNNVNAFLSVVQWSYKKNVHKFGSNENCSIIQILKDGESSSYYMEYKKKNVYTKLHGPQLEELSGLFAKINNSQMGFFLKNKDSDLVISQPFDSYPKLIIKDGDLYTQLNDQTETKYLKIDETLNFFEQPNPPDSFVLFQIDDCMIEDKFYFVSDPKPVLPAFENLPSSLNKLRNSEFFSTRRKLKELSDTNEEKICGSPKSTFTNIFLFSATYENIMLLSSNTRIFTYFYSKNGNGLYFHECFQEKRYLYRDGT